ncbi:MAG: TIGR03790 family protein [Deltaproteobacteria bacterium]|nr:TIGR03790 family protein [Deltaproteobacteria bacterium]
MRTRHTPWLTSLITSLLSLAGCPVTPGEEPPTEQPGPQLGEPLGLALPRTGIGPSELAVVVNTDDPLSASIADAYMEARGIPPENRVELALGGSPNLSREVFIERKAELDGALGDDIQAIALTSMSPQTVDCMATSAAFALGFDTRWCQPGPPCNPTALADTYDSDSTTPWLDHGVRPTMILAAQDLAWAQSLIDRGVAADGTMPRGSGFFVRTTDSARSTRWQAMQQAATDWGEELDLSYIDNADGEGSNLIEDEDDILFYLTGLVAVDGITSNTFRPGALADHLTSFGGQIPESSQMSALRWLEGGATASYGTPIEPCNFATKFPDPEVLVPRYLAGRTAVEAYWSSVWMPGEGNFLGEPLARPFAGAQTTYEDGLWTIVTTNLTPDQRYQLQVATAPDGPWEEVFRVEFPTLGFHTVEVPDPIVGWYRFAED